MPNTALVTAGSVLTATEFNYLPRGYIGKAERTSGDQTGITTATDILTNAGSALGVTWTANSTRVYRTTLFIGYAEQQTAANYPTFAITDGSNGVKAQALAYELAGTGDNYIVVAIETGLSGSVTRKGRASTGAGTLTVTSSATNPVVIFVEDIGAA